MRWVLIVNFLSVIAGTSAAAEVPKPTEADVAYGPEPRQVLDFYQAESPRPTPVLVVIHGGGWLNGDKRTFNNQGPYLAAGISVVSVEYRFVSHAAAAGVKPPVQWPMHDAARAVQFVRSKASAWNLDASRVAATGSSAGACTCLWLAFHDDLADPKSTDPVARQSTRLTCAAVSRAQTSLDPKQMREWIPNNRYGAHAFGFTAPTGLRRDAFDEFLASREKILPWIAEYSPYALATADDPPIGLYYDAAPMMGQDQPNPAHSPNFGEGLRRRLVELNVDCEFVYPGTSDVKHPQVHDYIIERLK